MVIVVKPDTPSQVGTQTEKGSLLSLARGPIRVTIETSSTIKPPGVQTAHGSTVRRIRSISLPQQGR